MMFTYTCPHCKKEAILGEHLCFGMVRRQVSQKVKTVLGRMFPPRELDQDLGYSDNQEPPQVPDEDAATKTSQYPSQITTARAHHTHTGNESPRETALWLRRLYKFSGVALALILIVVFLAQSVAGFPMIMGIITIVGLMASLGYYGLRWFKRSHYKTLLHRVGGDVGAAQRLIRFEELKFGISRTEAIMRALERLERDRDR